MRTDRAAPHFDSNAGVMSRRPAARAAQERKCLGGHGWPREAAARLAQATSLACDGQEPECLGGQEGGERPPRNTTCEPSGHHAAYAYLFRASLTDSAFRAEQRIPAGEFAQFEAGALAQPVLDQAV